MSSSIEHENDPPLSARQLRQQFKQSQATETHLRLFHLLGHDLFDQGWNMQSAEALLHALCSFTSAEHGLIAIELSGVLQIHAQVGRTLPVGSRVPMMGILGSILKTPVNFQLAEFKKTPFWTYEDTQMHECLIPLANNKNSVGLLALSGKKLALNEPELHTLKSLAGLLASVLSKSSGQQSTVDRSILERLTPREREILALLPGGPSNAQIGAILGIAAGTAKIHVERVINKLGVKDRTQAAVKAVELGYRAE